MAPTAITRDDGAQAPALLTPEEPPRLLFIDAFDSFTNNIISLLERSLKADITLIHINDEHAEANFDQLIRQVDAVVVGPGPGHPANSEDVGLINRLWKLEETNAVPVLGICLGFQSLCLNHGATVKKLRQARHGLVCEVEHRNSDIFSGVGLLEATQYHSLHVDLRGENGNNASVTWEPTEQCPELVPLAWDTNDELNGPLLMGVRHASKPLWGVQFHPESICTSDSGTAMIENWWIHARAWLSRPSKEGQPRTNGFANGFKPNTFTHKTAAAQPSNGSAFTNGHSPGSQLARELVSIAGTEDIFLRWGRHSGANITATDLVEALNLSREEVILLDSQGHNMGRFSILGVLSPGKTMKVCYNSYSKVLRYGIGSTQMRSMQLESVDQVWPILQEAADLHNPSKHGNNCSRASSPGPEIQRTGLDRYISGHLPEDSPFWGGFMGYISYEAGLETIDVDLHPSCAESIPDINFAFVHRSIVIDHETCQVYIQSLLPGDWLWILDVGRTVDAVISRADFGLPKPPTGCRSVSDMLADHKLTRPTSEAYQSKVLKCQESLASGDSYELCLTDESEILVPTANKLDSWALYKQLRKNNPAPFGAYVHLSDVTIVGSSPERFLNWTRQGRCQFRPIKGTVKKGPGMTRELAHEILGSSKERAENLMIVDLIRHDLCGVVGANNSWVSKLMVIEEYEKVYQLVSVIEGQMPAGDDHDGPRGIDVLKASLPPGSMTGAPKKRSCEILRDLEQRPRGVYSGVLGYLDVGGGGDFSVVIRTAVSHDAHEPNKFNMNGNDAMDGERTNGRANPEFEVWKVGAGGAVTIQSTAVGEFEEMETKASSVLDALLHEK